MKEMLHEIFSIYEQNDEFKRQLENYARYIESNDGRFIRDTFTILKGSILGTLLSAKFTKLDQTEKDVMQRTFYHTSQMLDFLIAPVKAMQKKEHRRSHLNRVEQSSGKKGAKNDG